MTYIYNAMRAMCAQYRVYALSTTTNLLALMFPLIPLMMVCVDHGDGAKGFDDGLFVSLIWHHFPIVFVAFALVLGIDYINEEKTRGTRQNIKKMQAHGFNLRKVVAYTLWNLSAAIFATDVVFYYIVGVRTISFNEYSILSVVRGVLTALLTDIVFYYAHYALHHLLASLHVMHHCCTDSTGISAFMFQPPDFIIEFIPVLSVVAFVDYLHHDPYATAVAFTVLEIWYVLGHDQGWGLAHYKHHQLIATNYCIYFPARTQQLDQTDYLLPFQSHAR